MVLALWWTLLYLLIVGLAAGWAAWLILGKKKSLSKNRGPAWAPLLAIGVAGSFLGGLGISLLSGDGFNLRPSGMVASIIGAVAVAAIYLQLQGRRS